MENIFSLAIYAVLSQINFAIYALLSKTHKYFLFDFFATNADYFSFSQTQTKEILTSFDVFGLREASA